MRTPLLVLGCLVTLVALPVGVLIAGEAHRAPPPICLGSGPCGPGVPSAPTTAQLISAETAKLARQGDTDIACATDLCIATAPQTSKTSTVLVIVATATVNTATSGGEG